MQSFILRIQTKATKGDVKIGYRIPRSRIRIPPPVDQEPSKIKYSDFEEAFRNLTEKFEKIKEHLTYLVPNESSSSYIKSSIDKFFREENELFEIPESLYGIDLRLYEKEAQEIQYCYIECFLRKSLDLAEESKFYNTKNPTILASFLNIAEYIIDTVQNPELKRLTTFNLKFLSLLKPDELKSFPNLEEIASQNKKRYLK